MRYSTSTSNPASDHNVIASMTNPLVTEMNSSSVQTMNSHAVMMDEIVIFGCSSHRIERSWIKSRGQLRGLYGAPMDASAMIVSMKKSRFMRSILAMIVG